MLAKLKESAQGIAAIAALAGCILGREASFLGHADRVERRARGR